MNPLNTQNPMTHPKRDRYAAHCLFSALAFLALFALPIHADLNPETGAFTYSGQGDIDMILGQISLYLLENNRRDGIAYVSRDIEDGIVGYQLRYFDNGNRVVDQGDWFSVRRYRIPAEPDTTRPAGYYKNDYMEIVDVNLDGIDEKDYYFINGRRFDLIGKSPEFLRQYQIQIESGVTAFLRQVNFQTIVKTLGARGQTAIKRDAAFDDGSLPAQMVLGLDLKYVFRPLSRGGAPLSEREMIEDIRQRIGFVFSATVEYTDLTGYRFRDLSDQTTLMQRTYDPIEKPVLTLIIDALFDTNGDGIITPENIANGYTRFREIHQQLIESARNQNRRIVLPGEKLARLREEYQAVRKKPFPIDGN